MNLNLHERDNLYRQVKEVAKMFKLTLETVHNLKAYMDNQQLIDQIDQKEHMDKYLIESISSNHYMSDSMTDLITWATQLANSLSNFLKILKELN
jgi:hypothetical protein